MSDSVIITPLYHFDVSTTRDKSGNDITLLTAQEHPWSVLQIVPIPEGKFEASIEILKKRGMVAIPNGRKDFAVIHVGSGDVDGKHPERYVQVTQANHEQIIESLKECMRQGAAWWAKCL